MSNSYLSLGPDSMCAGLISPDEVSLLKATSGHLQLDASHSIDCSGLLDAQLSAEYVAYGIRYLAPQSATKKVALIGHSQGAGKYKKHLSNKALDTFNILGLNPQWALIFWPSTKKLVSNYIALSGDFHGTDEGLLLCTLGNGT